MYSPAVALMWEFVRRGTLSYLGTIALVLALPTGIVALITAVEGQRPPAESEWLELHIAYLAMSAILYMSLALYAQSDRDFVFPTRLLTLPVRTSQLVAWRMLIGAVYTIASYVITTLGMRWVFGVQWPLVGPAIYLALTVAAAEAAAWAQTDFRWWKILASIAAVALLVFGIILAYHPNGLRQPAVLWWDVTPLQWAALGLGLVWSYLAAVAAVAQLRRSHPRPWPKWQELVEWLKPRRQREVPFARPHAAQLWYEWHQKGLAMPIVLSVFLLVALGFSWNLPAAEKFFMVYAIGHGLPLLGFVVGILLGDLGRFGKSQQCSSFRGSRPLTDAALALSILKTGALSVLFSLTIVAVVALVMYTLAPSDMIRETLQARFQFGPLLPVLAVTVLSWTTMSGVACITMTGRSWLMISVATGCVLLMSAPLAMRILLEDAVRLRIESAMPSVGGSFFLAGFVVICGLALQRRLVSLPYVLGTLLLAIVIAGGLVGIVATERSIDAGIFLLLCGVATLPAAPLAAAPLAVHWNRHR